MKKMHGTISKFLEFLFWFKSLFFSFPVPRFEIKERKSSENGRQ